MYAKLKAAILLMYTDRPLQISIFNWEVNIRSLFLLSACNTELRYTISVRTFKVHTFSKTGIASRYVAGPSLRSTCVILIVKQRRIIDIHSTNLISNLLEMFLFLRQNIKCQNTSTIKFQWNWPKRRARFQNSDLVQSRSQSLLTSYGACSTKTKALERTNS